MARGESSRMPIVAGTCDDYSANRKINDCKSEDLQGCNKRVTCMRLHGRCRLDAHSTIKHSLSRRCKVETSIHVGLAPPPLAGSQAFPPISVAGDFQPHSMMLVSATVCHTHYSPLLCSFSRSFLLFFISCFLQHRQLVSAG